MSVLMGIDLGTSSVKTMLLREDGQVLALAGAGYDVSIPKAGYAEQDPQMWYEKMIQTIQEALAFAGISKEEIASVSFSGQMHGLVCVDTKGNALRPAIIWQDQRAVASIRQIYQTAGEEFVIEQIQNRISAGFLLGSLYWISREEPETYEKIHKVMLPKDYLKMRLTGEILTDYSDAAGSAAFDNIHMCWATPLIEKLNLRPELFPACMPSAHVVGNITQKASEETGLSTRTQVVNGGADQCMQGIGNGIIREGVFACNIGTGGAISTSITKPLYDPDLQSNTFAHVMDGYWYIMGACLCSGSSLKWYDQQIIHLGDYQKLNKETALRPAGSEGLLFLPYLVGERTPHQDPNARGMFCGLTLKHDQFHMARSVMEGVTFSLKDCMEVLLGLGISCNQVIASGGGANSPVWLQIQADILEQEIYKSITTEQACLGASITAGVGAGIYSSYQEASGQLLRLDDKIYTPIQENVKIYREYFQIFRELYQANRQIFHRLTELGSFRGAE